MLSLLLSPYATITDMRHNIAALPHGYAIDAAFAAIIIAIATPCADIIAAHATITDDYAAAFHAYDDIRLR